jgi:hypothetical protein
MDDYFMVFNYYFLNYFFYSPFGLGKKPPPPFTLTCLGNFPKGGRNYSPAGHGAGTQRAHTQKLNARKKHSSIIDRSIYDTTTTVKVWQ